MHKMNSVHFSELICFFVQNWRIHKKMCFLNQFVSWMKPIGLNRLFGVFFAIQKKMRWRQETPIDIGNQSSQVMNSKVQIIHYLFIQFILLFYLKEWFEWESQQKNSFKKKINNSNVKSTQKHRHRDTLTAVLWLYSEIIDRPIC